MFFDFERADMDRKERIFKYINSKEYIPLKFGELMMVLEVPKDDEAELQEILDTLCREGRIVRSKRGRYLPTPENVTSGTLRCNAGGKFGFVTPDNDNEPDIFILKSNLKDAIHGDKVLVSIDKPNGHGDSPEGHIKKVISHTTEQITGVVDRMRHKVFKIKPDDSRYFSYPRVSPGNMSGAKVGDRVLVSIEKIDNSGDIYGKIVTNFGSSRELSSSVNAIISENGIKTEFDREALNVSNKLGSSPSPSDLTGRLDLRDEKIFTIDGEDAKDFDDAVSIKRTDNGFRLGVHIADVSHYVKEGTALDSEAFSRATSVYLPGRVIPMLPEALSNGLCSLKPNEDRLTLSVIMEIDSSGNVTSHTLTESVICSCERLTYSDVNKLLDNDAGLIKRYSHILEEVHNMESLAEILRKKRKVRGAINFDFPESLIITDEEGYPIQIGVRERGVSNRMIEEFMLLANETVAEFAFWSELPFVYRIHEAPSYEKIQAFKAYAKGLGYTLKGKLDRTEAVHPKALEQILEQVSGRPEERALARNILQSLMKAEYSPNCIGHFGLAAKYYCHFTSPIRRYPDLAIHRILKAFINGEMKAHFSTFASAASERSTEREIAAQNAERAVEDTLKAFYMMDHIGELFDGLVSGITSFGMFVELPNTVEGLVRLQNMTDDYYTYQEESMTLIGKRHGIEYKIGDPVTVRLIGSDPISRQIDFELKGSKM